MTLITHLTNRLRAVATRRTLAISGVLFVLAAGVLLASPAAFSLPTVADACGQVAPDVRIYTSADDLNGFLAGCGTEGRAAYRNLQLADLVYPAIAGLFPAIALMMVLDRRRQRRPEGRDLTALALLPLLGAGFDYAENAIAWSALAAYPAETPLAPLFGIASITKQSVNWASWMLLLAGVALAGYDLVQQRHADRPGPHDPNSPARRQRPASVGHGGDLVLHRGSFRIS